MEYAIPVIFGYLLGSISPAAFLGKIKKVNMRQRGTGNLGATNTALLMGKKLGFTVMFFDIFKGALAVILSLLTYPIYSKLLKFRKKKYAAEILADYIKKKSSLAAGEKVIFLSKGTGKCRAFRSGWY